ncbi:MAG TPA: tRNA (guanosine(37)-N1)-methyltransferase TrmD [Patescibacteria group bacterium]|nr:tRNA (guanosine(37)-N1)-methyltransferase TrmD [Patescibacteria group bacterium]
MKISILTLFPEMFAGPFDYSIVKRAKEKGLVEIEFINIRDFGEGKHKIVDDTEYGGGIGMLMRVDIIHKAIQAAKNSFSQQSNNETIKQSVVLLSAAGKTFKQTQAKEFSKLDHLILICGHYEGIDDRIKKYIDEEVSIGDFVLTGGEIPAMLIADSVTRLIKDVLPEGATEDESFSEQNGEKLLEYPHYTKPQEYDEQKVPEVLLSGDHKKIATWRHQRAKERTTAIRPDLLKKEE